MSKSFSESIGKWASQSKERIQAVHRRSIELLADEMTTTKEMGGRLPHQTGNLMRSLLASTDGMPKTAEGPYAASNVGAITATLATDQPVWLAFQAIYARRRNYGFIGEDALGRKYNEIGDYFIEHAIEAWPTIVQLAAEDIQSKVESRA